MNDRVDVAIVYGPRVPKSVPFCRQEVHVSGPEHVARAACPANAT